jgi:hypothetical protein
VEGLLDRVGDALRRRGVLEVAGVADQRPARPVRLAEEAAQHRLGGEVDPADLLGIRQPVAVEPVVELAEAIEEGQLSLRRVAAGELRVDAENQQREVVLAGRPGQRAGLDHVDEEAIARRQAAPVAKHEGHLAGQRALLLEAEQAGEGRGPAVGAEHPACLDLLATLQHHTAHWMIWGPGADQPGHLLAEAGLRAGRDRDLEQRFVEHRPGDRRGAIEAADRSERTAHLAPEGPDPVLDQVHLVLGFDPPQRSQLRQPRQRVREQAVSRERVRRRRLAVDEQDPPAPLRQPRRQRRAGAASADHYRVVAAAPAAHAFFRPTVSRYSISNRASSSLPRFHSAQNSLRTWSNSSARPSFSALARAAIVGP